MIDQRSHANVFCVTCFNLGITLDVAKTLVEHGANIEAVNKYRDTPLISHSFYERNDIVKYLIEKGANVNAKNKEGETALHLSETLEIVKSLVEHGADIESVDHNENTPLIVHSKKGRVDIVKYLTIEKNANKKAKKVVQLFTLQKH